MWMGRQKAEYLVRNTTLILACVSLVLCLFLWAFNYHGIGSRTTTTDQDPFFYLLITFEPLGLAVTAAGFLLLYGLMRRPGFLCFIPSSWSKIGQLSSAQLAGLCVAVVALVSLGRHFVYQDYDTCADESLTHFQAEVFLSGHVLAPVPERWMPYANSIAIPLQTVNLKQQAWCSEFLPVHSLLSAPGTLLGMGGYTCAVFLGLNLALFYFLVRKLWPNHPSRALIGLVLYAAFSQVLITSMTSYSMETHALLTTLWLLLYLSESEALFLLTPWLGILCMGIHQPHIHLIFATPFVVRLALQRRFFHFAYFCSVYLAGLVFWAGYLHLIRPLSGASLFNKFGVNPFLQLLIQPGDVGMLLAWSPLLLSLLFALACLTLRRKNSVINCCLLSFVFLAGFYVIWPTQGHGWGERFLYPAIPFIVIVSLSAWSVLRLALGRGRTMNLLVFSAMFALAVTLPYRLWQVYHFQATYVAAHTTIAHTDADVVLLDCERIWYGRDLVLNDPRLANRPVVLALSGMTPTQLGRLKLENLRLKILGIDDIRTSGHPENRAREQD